MISVITVINKPEIYNTGLYKSISLQQGISYELIELFNVNGEFKSLAAAYKKGVEQCHGEWILFAHPDIAFNSEKTLSDFVAKATMLYQADSAIKLWGVAGSEQNKRHNVITAIEQGEKRIQRGKGYDENEYYYVQTVDACCYLVRKSLFQEISFGDYLTGFHMIVEDLCLNIEEHCGKVVVVPIHLWHFSDGNSLDYTYYRETIKLLRHYPRIKQINTTSFAWKNSLQTIVKLRFYEIRNYIHHRSDRMKGRMCK